MALLIKVVAVPRTCSLLANRGFRFKEMWTRHVSYKNTVKEAWITREHHGSGSMDFGTD
jgi:hypothetical protein